MLKLKRDRKTNQVFATATDTDARTCYLCRDQTTSAAIDRTGAQIVKFAGLLNKDTSEFMVHLGKVD